MPGNIIAINDWKQYYVGDSKMDKLFEWLNKNGFEEGNRE